MYARSACSAALCALVAWGQRAECKFLISAFCPLVVKIIGAMPCALRKLVLELLFCGKRDSPSAALRGTEFVELYVFWGLGFSIAKA